MARSPVALYCFEVGQGSCAALIDTVPGRRPRQYQATIIDTGVAGTRLARCLEGLGVRRIPALCLTHNDADHVRGLAAIVQAFRGRIGTVWLLVNRYHVPDSVWLPAAASREDRWVRAIERLEAPDECPPGTGRLVVGPPDTSYRLYCAYPTLFASEAVSHDAVRPGDPLGRGPNAASAVLRLTPDDAPSPTSALFGGDLDYRGWHHLVQVGRDLRAAVLIVPHHGGPAGADATFGPKDLVSAVRPTVALISVGTTNSYGHPHAALVQALRGNGTQVLCTQITGQCAPLPGAAPSGTVIPRLHELPLLGPGGVACAGTVVALLSHGAVPVVGRLADHQAAVDGLAAASRPLCRP